MFFCVCVCDAHTKEHTFLYTINSTTNELKETWNVYNKNYSTSPAEELDYGLESNVPAIQPSRFPNLTFHQ